MDKLNIVLDFTTNKSIEEMTAGQPVAVMPAELAKRALMALAQNMVKATWQGIVQEHIDRLDDCKSLKDATKLSIEFVQERQLIENLLNERWDVYNVDNDQASNNGPKVLGKIKLNEL